MLMIIFCITAYVVFGKNAEVLRKGIEISLEEDFKIKESLGKVFFLDKNDETQTVSSQVEITTMEIPCNVEFRQKEILGEKCIVFHCTKYESVNATADGVIEYCENSKISLRHSDGKLSTFYGVVCLLKQGDKVALGENIGYAEGEVTYKLYENCIALDPLEYLS